MAELDISAGAVWTLTQKDVAEEVDFSSCEESEVLRLDK
jgi:hypothetical protein